MTNDASDLAGMFSVSSLHLMIEPGASSQSFTEQSLRKETRRQRVLRIAHRLFERSPEAVNQTDGNAAEIGSEQSSQVYLTEPQVILDSQPTYRVDL